MEKSKEGVEEMRFDKFDPEFGGAQVNFDILRARSWSGYFDGFGRYKTGKSGSSDLSGEYRGSGLGLDGRGRGLPESGSLGIGLRLSDISRLEDERRLGVRSRLGLWWAFATAREIGRCGLLGGFWLGRCGFFCFDGFGLVRRWGVGYFCCIDRK